MTPKRLSHTVTAPALATALIEEITDIIFGETVDPEPCDLIFIFRGSHPGLWQNGASAYLEGY